MPIGPITVALTVDDRVIRRELADIRAYIDRLTLVAYEAWRVADTIREFGIPIEGIDALVDALSHLSSEPKGFSEIGSHLGELVATQTQQFT